MKTAHYLPFALFIVIQTFSVSQLIPFDVIVQVQHPYMHTYRRSPIVVPKPYQSVDRSPIFSVLMRRPHLDRGYPDSLIEGKPIDHVLAIEDGITIRIRINRRMPIFHDGMSTSRSIRLKGVTVSEHIDSLRAREYCRVQSYEFLRNLLANEHIWVVYTDPTERDSGCYLYRYPDGLFINLELVRQGYAKVDQEDFEYKPLFERYEAMAHKKRKGLWAYENAVVPFPSQSSSLDNLESPPIMSW
ncbi:MAG: thermonuclease family protein [Candidatus Poribacteria bacterium]|nr:thermonuclease family protein [Candidatus Poribacteria bacterium]